MLLSHIVDILDIFCLSFLVSANNAKKLFGIPTFFQKFDVKNLFRNALPTSILTQIEEFVLQVTVT